MYLRTILFINYILIVNSAPSQNVSFKHFNRISAQNQRNDSNSDQSLLKNSLDNVFVKNGTISSGGDPNSSSKGGEEFYDQMLGDQASSNSTLDTTNAIYLATMRNRAKDTRMQFLKNTILKHTGRGNGTTSTKISPPLNLNNFVPILINNTNFDDEVTEKMRSYYPSCDIPTSTEQEIWQNDNVMNLYFNFDHITNEKTVNIATATLRLYRIPENLTRFNIRNSDCEFNSTEEEKLIRVSIFWYIKSQRKRKVSVKHRLSDSKVIPESSTHVELGVKPAIQAWSKGRNLGLGVLVEDQDSNTLNAEKFFKGASCMVGASTPKPIPTIIVDAARKTSDLHRNGRNSTAIYSDSQLLPIIDICTLEFPENYTIPENLTDFRVNACNLQRKYGRIQKFNIEDVHTERPILLQDIKIPSDVHIRHQRQHLANKRNENQGGGDSDFRSRIINKVIVPSDQWQNFLNSSSINR